jgi:hypothetical protein
MSEASPVQLITIRAEVLQADPNACKFTVSRSIHPGGPFFYDRRERAVGSPLPELLFGLEGVAHVLISDNVVTVGKAPGAIEIRYRRQDSRATAHGRARDP